MIGAKQDWQYHGEVPVRGRKLVLLQQDEVVQALPLLYRLLPDLEIQNRKDWINEKLSLQQLAQSRTRLIDCLSILAKQRRSIEGLADALFNANIEINHYFSDHGWRMIRKELSQIKKRRKKSHIEVSNDLVHRLKAFMSLKQLDSFDQALDFLLSENEERNL